MKLLSLRSWLIERAAVHGGWMIHNHNHAPARTHVRMHRYAHSLPAEYFFFPPSTHSCAQTYTVHSQGWCMAAGEASDWNSILIRHSALLYTTVALIGVIAVGVPCRWRAQSLLATAGWVWVSAALCAEGCQGWWAPLWCTPFKWHTLLRARLLPLPAQFEGCFMKWNVSSAITCCTCSMRHWPFCQSAATVPIFRGIYVLFLLVGTSKVNN